MATSYKDKEEDHLINPVIQIKKLAQNVLSITYISTPTFIIVKHVSISIASFVHFN